MIRSAFLAGLALAFLSVCAPVRAEDCPDNPDALGTSRILPLSVENGPVGLLSYKKSLPLADHEVVLTFDDGPSPQRTPAVLDALRRECVKATFFTVGVMAAAYPKLLQDEAQAGHTIGTHSWSHKYLTQRRNRRAAAFQIAGGFHAADVALGEEKASLSPFFRFPGLNHNRRLDGYVAQSGLVAISVDIVGDDWLLLTPAEVMKRTLARLEQKGRGIILLHDIQNRTAQMLPGLLRELKARNYRIVHIVPERAETQLALARLPEPQSPTFQTAMAKTRTRLAKLSAPDQAPVASAPQPVETTATVPLQVAGAAPVAQSFLRIGSQD